MQRGGSRVSSPMDVTLLDALDRHARQRAQGLATLSLLVGEPERAWSFWARWLHRQGRRAVLSEAQDVGALVSAWAMTLSRARELTLDAERFVALPLQGKTHYERRVLLDSRPPPPDAPEAWALARRLLEADPPAPGALPEALREALAQDPLEVLRALRGLVPAEALPALLLRVGSATVAGMRALATLCSAVPELTVGGVLSPEAFTSHQRQGETRALALMREGRLDVATLVEEGRERALSEPEWFLYRLLHHRPETAGLFTLNAPVETRESKRPWQVDLLCRELKLAVEVDGYFHFRDASDFRRDRRKDVALQREGYLVYRVLADDVVERLEEILGMIDGLITQRRRELPHEKR